VAGESGAGQLGHGSPASVDESRHMGGINVLYLDGHTQSCVSAPDDGEWKDALRWKAPGWR
jgi:prepilin-type processing-associated H-X9-DG protein